MIHIFHISDGHKHFTEAVSEYEKRLGKNIEIHPLKPVKHTDIQYIKREETKKLIEKLKKTSGMIILCDERGKEMNTKEFSILCENAKNTGESIIFIIGGSYGVDIDTLEKVGGIRLLCLSSLVMPHGLAFLVLIEQIYRAMEIMK